METRGQQSRFDIHEEQIQRLQSDVVEIKGALQNLEKDTVESSEFRKVVLAWMKQHGKQPSGPASGSSGPGMMVDPPSPLTGMGGFGGGLWGSGDSSTTGGAPGPPWAVKKIPLPEFHGFDPQGWIQKALLYFDIHGTPAHLRVRLAQLSMCGVAQHWFTIVQQIHDPLLWDQLQTELLQRFSGLEIQNPYEQLATLQQSDSIHDFIDDFEYLLSLVPRLPESQALGYFIAGLRPEVKKWVRLHRPKSRLDAMYLAKDVEEMLRPSTGNVSHSRFRYAPRIGPHLGVSSDLGPKTGRVESSRPTSLIHHTGSFTPRGDPSPKSLPPSKSSITSSSDLGHASTRDRGVRSLTRTEWEDRRKKGLCFRCGLQFGPAHKCPEGKLRVLLLADDEDASFEDGTCSLPELTNPLDVPISGSEEGQCSVLDWVGECSTAVGGKTLKFDAELAGVSIVVMVDSGASHNFVSRHLVSALGLSYSKFAGINIKLGDGHVVFVQDTCQSLVIHIGMCSFEIEALIFDTGNKDLILGMPWLKSLGEVTHDWSRSWMKFIYQGHEVQLQGLQVGQNPQPSLHYWLHHHPNMHSDTHHGGLAGSSRTMEQLALPTSQQHALQEILLRFDTVFQAPSGLPPVRSHDHGILLRTPLEPICVRPYRYPHVQKTEIEKQVAELLAAGMIRPSTSPYSSPVILVRKKDGSWRMCVDYRALNKATVPDKFPIPVVDELIDELHGAHYFSKLDLKSGYNQIRMREDSIEKTAFRTHEGHYEYLVMPFGLMNAPSTFQAIMNEVFRPLLRRTVVVFFDDILIFSKSWEAHLNDLARVLGILAHHHLVVNKKKCSFGRTQVEYLGHIIDGTGVAMDPQKIIAITDWPVPRHLKGLRGFLGLTGYYRKFVKNYGSIARPLTDLTKKDAFKWNSEAQAAFDHLKAVMTSAPVLALPDFSSPFVIECDASGRGIGAVLMQHHKPVAYFSKGLSDKNLAKSAYEREIMALVLAVQHWRSYLLGTRFLVYTDQKSLKFLLHQRITTPDQQNWVAKLLGYDFDILYKPGRENRAADALSRRADVGCLNQFISTPVWVQGAHLVAEAKADPEIQNIIRGCQAEAAKFTGFTVKQGVLYYKDRLVIARNSKLIPELLREFHQAASGGHSGYYRTYRRLATNLYWPGMIGSVKNYVRACDICQRCKASSLAPSGLLQPLSIPRAVWEDLSMDFIVGLPKSKGFDAILVVVDRLSKYSHFILLKHPYNAKSVAELFVREVIRHHGIPKSIVSDRDPLFLSTFWREIFKAQGTQLNMSSAYHPESDGQTEVINRCLETYLRCFAVDQPRTWAYWIPWAEFWYNSSFHGSTGTSPFEVVYGRKPPTVVQFVAGEVRVEAVAQELQDRDEAIRQLRAHLAVAQTSMKENADKRRRDVSFVVGEWVYVKLKPYRQLSVTARIHPKLGPKFFGPFQVEARIGPVAYKLTLPPTSRIHPVFHVSLLKKAVAAPSGVVLPPELNIGPNELMVPGAILAKRPMQGSSSTGQQWLIQWLGQSEAEATWEDASLISQQFPNTSLEDKTFSDGGSNDTIHTKGSTSKPFQVYSRRGKTGIIERGEVE